MGEKRGEGAFTSATIGASDGDRIYVITGNGIAGRQERNEEFSYQVLSPGAPSLVCLDKNSGKVLWSDNSPGTNIYYGQWGSPLVVDVGGRGQVIAPQGDGWLRSFDALTGELLWKLNINLSSVTNRYYRNHFLNAPVLYKERIFIGGGNDVEHGEGPGSLFCIDPTRRGDVSLELDDGPSKGKPNPNSAVVWSLASFGRTIGQVAIHDDLVIAAGFNGFVHCLDAKTGKEYWIYDMRAHIWGSPLIADGKIFVGDEDGDACVLELSKEMRLLFTASLESSILSSPIFANGVLYLATGGELFAIQQGALFSAALKSCQAMKVTIQPCIWYRLVCGITLLVTPTNLNADDWPMLGRDQTRNPVSPEKGAPIEWDAGTGRNIKWKAKLGSITFSDPIVANGLVWIGSNNEHRRNPEVKREAAVLLCFRESDGEFLYQFVVPEKAGLFYVSRLGFNGSPLAEGDRLWFTTLVGDVHCFDVTPLLRGPQPPTPIWKVDLPDELGVFPHYPYMADGKTCSLSTPYKNRIYVITGNAAGRNFQDVPSPSSPSLICLDKDTGKLLWEDNSPGSKIIRGQWASPLVIEINGRAQVITPQGDGWVRSFDAMTGELIWKLDINPKIGGMRNHFMNAPVFYENRVYIGGGHSLEEGSGPGRLFCIDPTKKGDLSPELDDGPDQSKPNPNSGVVWSLAEFDRTHSLVAIHAGLLIAADFSGNIYCLNARTGEKFWQQEPEAEVFGSPLIVDNKIYLANQDGEIFIFALSREKQLVRKSQMSAQGAFAWPIYSSPIFANGVLYIANQEVLYAIQQGASSPPPPKAAKP